VGWTVQLIKLLLPIGEAKYFCKEGWTAKLQNSPSGKSLSLRRPGQAEREINH
jgi:hypothetical protein